MYGMARAAVVETGAAESKHTKWPKWSDARRAGLVRKLDAGPVIQTVTRDVTFACIATLRLKCVSMQGETQRISRGISHQARPTQRLA